MHLTTTDNLSGNASGSEIERANGKLALSFAEIISETGLGRSSLYKAIAQGKLKAKKAGSRTIILRADLNEFLAALPAATFKSGKSV